MFLNANFQIANEANTELKIEGGSFKGNSIWRNRDARNQIE